MKCIQSLIAVAVMCGTTSCCDMKFAGMQANSYAAKFHDAVREDVAIKEILLTKPTNIEMGVWADACGNVLVQLGTPSSVQNISSFQDSRIVETIKTNATIDASTVRPHEVRSISETIARYAWIWDYRGTLSINQAIGGQNRMVLKKRMRSLVPETFTATTHSFNPANIHDHD